jgi:hypothetical protein
MALDPTVRIARQLQDLRTALSATEIPEQEWQGILGACAGFLLAVRT